MSSVGATPRPSVFTVFVRTYSLAFAGFTAFLPTLLIFCLAYFLVSLLAYQFDPSVPDPMIENESDPFSVDWLSPLTWIDLLFVPCAIWWHRFVWSGEAGRLWVNVFSKDGGKYFLLTFVLLLGNHVATYTVNMIEPGAGRWPYFLLLVLLLPVFIASWIAFIPIFVSFAVGYKEGLRARFRHLKGNIWYCLAILISVHLPWVVVGFAAVFIPEGLWPLEFAAEQMALCLILVVSGSIWACAQTIIFSWMVDRKRADGSGRPTVEQG